MQYYHQVTVQVISVEGLKLCLHVQRRAQVELSEVCRVSTQAYKMPGPLQMAEGEPRVQGGLENGFSRVRVSQDHPPCAMG